MSNTTMARPIDSLIDDFFASLTASQTSSLASYVLHIDGESKQEYFKYATDEIIAKLVCASPGTWSITGVYRDGSVRDVTSAWRDAIEKKREMYGRVDRLVETFERGPDVVTYNFLVSTDAGPVSVSYFVHPTRAVIQSWTRYRPENIIIRAVMKDGQVNDVTIEFKHLLEAACRLR